jgi:hypothetical protein
MIGGHESCGKPAVFEELQDRDMLFLIKWVMEIGGSPCNILPMS